jgi:hypothetical protein
MCASEQQRSEIQLIWITWTPSRMDTNFSACVSGLLSMVKTYHMDASILDKMKYFDFGTLFPNAHHTDNPVDMCTYLNGLLFKDEQSSLSCCNGCVHLTPLPAYPEATWNLYFQIGTDGTFIRGNFRAINQAYSMTAVKKEVERGAINGSSFRSLISIMGYTHKPLWAKRTHTCIYQVVCTRQWKIFTN